MKAFCPYCRNLISVYDGKWAAHGSLGGFCPGANQKVSGKEKKK